MCVLVWVCVGGWERGDGAFAVRICSEGTFSYDTAKM